ncbi:DUF5518 domain-containing protein [Halosolutus gelatinilyticus]|uniref:DUF5518 domain-containing protein n=1 Tax=Halosolutus gelatinilyticus TaxID=2931975 RepID=UPI001FF60468|nr:DUF5518 domain-containing protein [Halosolutus gelatinilyticus]
MDPQSSHPAVETPETDRRSSTAINALIGGVAGIVLSFVPLSTLLGGAVAGYLEGSTTNDGLRVGAIAGLVMLLPMLFIGLFLVPFILGFWTGGGPSFALLAIFVLVFGAVYTVGLSAVGGILGVYVKDEL